MGFGSGVLAGQLLIERVFPALDEVVEVFVRDPHGVGVTAAPLLARLSSLSEP